MWWSVNEKIIFRSIKINMKNKKVITEYWLTQIMTDDSFHSKWHYNGIWKYSQCTMFITRFSKAFEFFSHELLGGNLENLVTVQRLQTGFVDWIECNSNCLVIENNSNNNTFYIAYCHITMNRTRQITW